MSVGLREDQEAVLVTLIERKTRYELIMKADGKTVESITKAVNKLLKMKTAYFSSIFQTITSANGTEFPNLNGRTDAYFTHPYSSWERGSNENRNGIIRRFIPKGTNITTISERTIQGLKIG